MIPTLFQQITAACMPRPAERHSPRDQRALPFAEQVEPHEFRDAAIGAAIFAAFVGALATMPWWLP